MANEIELKLELTPDGVAAVEASGLLPPEAILEKQISIYFDTPERHLAKTGLSLRIRRVDGKGVQTVKAEGGKAAGLLARPEWERAVVSDLPIVDDTVPIRAMIGEAASRIGPVFEVRIDRLCGLVKDGGATIEMALDRGEVEVDGRKSPICEVELELKEGHPAALFALARRIDALTPVHIDVLSKGERGYQLFGPMPEAIKPGTVTLTQVMTVAEAFQAIVHGCMRHFRLNETLLLQTRQAGPLHQCRVALRRLRSAFTIFKSVTSSPEGDRLRQELRWLAGELGDARNLDVLVDRAEPGPLHDRLQAVRESTYDHVGETLSSPRARSVMLDLVEWVAMGDWLDVPESGSERARPVREFAGTALDRFRRKVRKKGRDLGTIDASQRHEVRKDAKKLRYAAEFFVSLFDRKREKRRYKQFIKALEELQDLLGKLNDIATAPEVLRHFDLAEEPGAASLLASGNEAKLVGRAVEAHEDFVDAKRFWR